MGGWSLSEKAYRLRNEYQKKLNKRPRGWAWEEETMEEYERYLKEEIKSIESKH